MSEYTAIELYVNHVMHEITKRDVEQVSERLRALGWEEIMRCRDCVFYESVAEDSGDWCGYWTDRVYVNVRGDGFCAWGERRSE